MRILITGGAGYLGSVTSLLALAQGHDVRVVDNLLHGATALAALRAQNHFEFCRADICDQAAMAEAARDMDAVVHLAAIVGDPACSVEPDLARKVNYDAAVQLFETCRRAGAKRFVFASTCSNYGRMADSSVPATEDFELRPVSLYAETKVAVERRLLQESEPGMTVTVLRFSTLFGLSPRMRFDLTVNEFVMRVLSEGRLVVYGEQFWRPYVHVSDAARAILKLLEAPPEIVQRQVFNVGDTGENYRKLDLVEIIRDQLGEYDVKFVKRHEDPRDYRVSFERIKNTLGYAITRRVSEGVNEIAASIRSGALHPLDDPQKYNTAPVT